MRSIFHNPRNHQGGFTLIETLIILPAILLVMTALVVVMMSLLSVNSAADAKVTMAYDTQNAFDYIETDARTATRFLVTNDSNLSDAYGPDNTGAAWDANTATNGFKPLILREYATNAPSPSGYKSLVYVNQYGCGSSVLNSNPPLTLNVIYFVRNNTLYKRTLVDTSQSVCGYVYQQQTCPADATPPLDPSCKGTDVELLDDVTSATFTYYSNSLSVVDSSTQSSLDAAVSVGASLGITRTINGAPASYLSSIFINKLNTY